jgi:endonuclease/exonuclease/phosphatase family metal-dependent hydrolase
MSAPDSAPVVAAGAAAPTITVVTLNLLHGAPLPGKGRARVSIVERLEHVAARLEALAPDVILLQEASRGARHDVTAAILARRLGMDWVYAPANPAWIWGFAKVVMRLVPNLEFEEGPAVLSRLPILERHVHRLSSWMPSFEQRIAVEAVLGGPRGPFSVFSVHLSAFSDAGRRRQAAALLRAVGSSPHHHPTIVGGDFNAEEHAHEMRFLTRGRGWLDTFREVHPGEPGYTSPQALDATAATASRRIDFLFSVPAGGERWRPHDARLVLDGALPSTADGVLWASDHYGVLARLTLEHTGGPLPDAAPAADRPPGAGPERAPRPARLLDWQLAPALRARAVTLVGDAASRAPGDDWRTLADDVRARHPDDFRAVIGYGSWFTPGLRKTSSFPDLYVLVHDCERLHGARLRGAVNRLLPPDVGYLWIDQGERAVLAGKLNVLDAQQLARECGAGLRDLYNAGRLSKLV